MSTNFCNMQRAFATCGHQRYLKYPPNLFMFTSYKGLKTFFLTRPSVCNSFLSHVDEIFTLPSPAGLNNPFIPPPDLPTHGESSPKLSYCEMALSCLIVEHWTVWEGSHSLRWPPSMLMSAVYRNHQWESFLIFFFKVSLTQMSSFFWCFDLTMASARC